MRWELPRGATARTTCRLSASLLGVACSLLVLTMPAWGATGAWDRTWGKDVIAGNADTGPEICTVAALCQTGQDGSGPGEFTQPKDVAVAPNGNVYVADASFGGRIEVFDQAGNFIRMFGQLSAPNSIAIDGDGNVYVTESAPRILKFDAEGHFLRTWGKDVIAGNAETGPEICTVESQCQHGTQTEDDGSHLAYEGGAFGFDNQVAVSPGGTVYVMEDGRGRISEFDSSGHFLRLWGKDVIAGNAGTGAEICTVSAQCKVGDSGTAGGELSSVLYGATDAAGNLYVANSAGGSRVDEFASSGAFLRAFGKNVDGANPGTGFEVCTNAADCLGGDRASTAGAFDEVVDVAVDAAGNVYTIESENHRIQKFTAAGAFVSTWGKGVNGGSGLETCTTVNGCSGGELGGKGGEIDSSFPGIGANPLGGRTLYTAEGFEGRRVQVFGAHTPSLTSTSPASPSNDNQPKLIGSAQEGATVTVYANSSCTGAVKASGSAATLASPGLPVAVADNSTTTFYATATAGGETSDCSPVGLTYVEDSTPPPTPTISSTSPASPSDDQSPEVRGSAEAGSTVRLYTDMACGGTPTASGSAATFASPGLTVSVAKGSSTMFFARATDVAGNVSGCSLGVVYESTRDTAITSGPDGATGDPAPSFGFTADPAPGASFVCSVDHATPSPCSSPSTTGHLSDGSHEFEVAAVSPSGAQDPTPATRSFFVDTVAPATTPQILGGQRVGQSNTYHGSVLLNASASDPAPSGGGVQTRCEYTGAGAPAPDSFGSLPDGCTQPIVSEPGDYAFYAASRDAAGNVEPAVRSVKFTILPGVDVSITSGPEGATWQKQPLFGFTSATAGATYRCSIGGGTYVTCQSPWLSPVQNPGNHAFYVKAVAPDGTDSNVEARYYTIQAPTDPANEPHGHCAVNPFVVDPDNPNGGSIVGCGFGQCPRRIACSPAIPPCPVGAICTLRFTSHFEDADPSITFALLSYCQQHLQECTGLYDFANTWRVTHAFDGRLHESAGDFELGHCYADVLADPKACDLSSTVTIVGLNRTISPICSALIEDSLGGPLKPGVTQPRDFGPDSRRHLDCDVTESIAPASALDLASVPPGPLNSYVYAPATGALTMTPGAPFGRGAAFAARKRPPQPGIKSMHITVKHPGAIPFRFHLNKAATRLLARRHKLKLRVKITLKPPHHAAITRTHTVTFTHPAKPASARQRRRAARRLCVRQHPHQARLCNRL
jgi:hypothetical protein